MKTETTYTISQLREKSQEYVAFLKADSSNKERVINVMEIAINCFRHWLTPTTPALGWVGHDRYGNVFFREKPDSFDIQQYNMREIIFKPEDTK